MVRCISYTRLCFFRKHLLFISIVQILLNLIHNVQYTLAIRNKPVLVQQLPQGELMEPANSPSMDQEYARYLTQYMQNLHRDNIWPQLNLAQINNRAHPPVPIHQQSSSLSPHYEHPYRQHNQFTTELASPQSSGGIRRDDVVFRKGKVDDVLIFKDQMKGVKGAHPQRNWLMPMVPPFKDKLFHQNCITRATRLVSTCEDHLIRRLNQDATEGRTVIDVGRRVCCALFWHKDCISSKVVEACPDSSPAAVDYLLGSRKVDLTLSCQKFNRDGCNGAKSLVLSTSYITLQVLLLYSVVLLLMKL